MLTILHVESFQAVTVPKADLWLVYTGGSLITVIGVSLLAVAQSPTVERTLWTLATSSYLALSLVDIVFVARRIIRPIYLLDSLLELCFFGLCIRWRVPEGRFANAS